MEILGEERLYGGFGCNNGGFGGDNGGFGGDNGDFGGDNGDFGGDNGSVPPPPGPKVIKMPLFTPISPPAFPHLSPLGAVNEGVLMWG